MDSAPPPRKKDVILDAATRLFAERGYEGASMADLAELVGLRKASLFHHFPSKDALYGAVFERMVNALGGPVIAAASTQGSFVERLDTMTDAITMVLADQRFAARLAVRELMDWGPYAQQHFRDTIRPVLDAAEQFVAGGQKDGTVVNTCEARQVVLSVFSMYFMPFAIANVVEELTGSAPFAEPFVGLRRQTLKQQIHAMLLLEKN